MSILLGLKSLPVVVLKNCKPGLCYITADLFNLCFNKSCFPDCWKVPFLVSVFNNVGERSIVKNYTLVFFLWACKLTFRNVAFFWIQVWFQAFSFNCRCCDGCIWQNCYDFFYNQIFNMTVGRGWDALLIFHPTF